MLLWAAASYFALLPCATAGGISGATIAVEPGGGWYFVHQSTPKGVGIGGRLSVPVVWGFEIAAGYTVVDVKSTALPMTTHHAYGALAYRLDDFKYFSPWVELGAGFFRFALHQKGRAPVDDCALHVSLGADFIWHHLLLGAFARYEIYPLTGLTTFPSGMAAGLRIGAYL